MLRSSTTRLFIWKLQRMRHPPISGYELTEFSSEQLLRQFITFHQNRVVVAVVHANPPVLSKPSPMGKATVKLVPKGETEDAAEDIFLTPEQVQADRLIQKRKKAIQARMMRQGAKAAGFEMPVDEDTAQMAEKYDAETIKFISAFNEWNFGDAREVRFATIPISKAGKFADEFELLGTPTSLIFYKGKVMSRVVGFRPIEIATKTKFLLRNEGMSIMAVDN